MSCRSLNYNFAIVLIKMFAIEVSLVDFKLTILIKRVNYKSIKNIEKYIINVETLEKIFNVFQYKIYTLIYIIFNITCKPIY